MRFSSGFGLIEVVIGSAILSVVFVGLAAAFQLAFQVNRETLHNLQANFLLEEGVEAARIMRDRSWENLANLSTTTTYYLSFENGTWATTTSSSLVDGTFERTVEVDDVYRDANDDVAESGTYDAGTRRVDVSVSWFGRGATSTKSVSTYFANIFE